MPFLDRLQQFEPRLARHADVRHEDLGHAGLESLQRIARIGETSRRKIFAGQRFFKHPANRFVIVNNPDRLHSVFSCPASQGVYQVRAAVSEF
ncbi:hypothetical protein D9M68_947420 [compost metagenome]